MNEFKTLGEGFVQFRRHAVSDLTPPRITEALKGAYFAGAQCALVLLQEAQGIKPMLAPKEVLDIFNECQAFFITAKAQAVSRLEVRNSNRKGKKT